MAVANRHLNSGFAESALIRRKLARRSRTLYVHPPRTLTMITKSALPLVAVAFLVSFSNLAADWNQYRGPQHNGISSERIAKWPEAGPKLLWKTPMNGGFSSIAVADGVAATLVLRDKDGVSC